MTKNSLLLSALSNPSVITLKDTQFPLKFGPTIITLPTFAPNRNSPAAKHVGPSFCPSTISQSSTNLALLTKPMLCPGGQTIKRGYLLWMNTASFSTRNSFLSAPPDHLQ